MLSIHLHIDLPSGLFPSALAFLNVQIPLHISLLKKSATIQGMILTESHQ
jgi:hypothetical protein